MTTVALLRLRFKLTVHARRERLLLAEESAAFAWTATTPPTILTADPARTLLDTPASSDIAPNARQRLLGQALERLPSMLDGPIAQYARERATTLAEDHTRVRAAAAGSARVSVEPALPPDVIGLYVLVPGAGNRQ